MNTNTNATTAKIAARIAAKMETSSTVREAVATAAWEGVQDAKRAGWSDETIAAMMQAFADVAADMVAATVEAAA